MVVVATINYSNYYKIVSIIVLFRITTMWDTTKAIKCLERN